MKKPATEKKDDNKKAANPKEDKPKFEELIFTNLCDPKMTFDHTGYSFTTLNLDVYI